MTSIVAVSALDRIYDDHAQALFGFAWNWTRSDVETEEVLQDVFAQLAKDGAARLAEIQHERAFLIQMVRRRLIDRERKDRRRRQREIVCAGEENPSLFESMGDPDRATFRQALEEGLATLPPMQRAVVYLKLWEEFTFEQIAQALGILPNTAASRYRLGLKKLRERLRSLYNEILP